MVWQRGESHILNIHKPECSSSRSLWLEAFGSHKLVYECSASDCCCLVLRQLPLQSNTTHLYSLEATSSPLILAL